MGRKRTRDFDLPPRMARKGAALYYVTNERPRRWIPLGTDLNRARRTWADLECSKARIAELERERDALVELLIESQSSIGGDWRNRRDAAIAAKGK
jgi:hypothetical protein